MVTDAFLGMPPAGVERWIKNQRRKEPLCFTAVDAGATITFKKQGSPAAASIVISRDKSTWEPYAFNDEVILANVGDKVYFRAADENDISFFTSSRAYYRFATTAEKKIAASGNISTLTKADGSRLDISEKIRCYAYMFSGCESLTTAPALPATTLAERCYYGMFENCTSLTTAPALPATTLATACYYGMFIGCHSLTTAPKLPVKTLTTQCYTSMFQGCISLTAAPELPATTLADSCYRNMFLGCTSLTTAPKLPATTLVNNCYDSMFSGCTSLSSVEVAFTTWTSGATDYWLNNVAASGTFTCPAELPDTRGENNIPEGWTKADK